MCSFCTHPKHTRTHARTRIRTNPRTPLPLTAQERLPRLQRLRLEYDAARRKVEGAAHKAGAGAAASSPSTTAAGGGDGSVPTLDIGAERRLGAATAEFERASEQGCWAGEKRGLRESQGEAFAQA
jgi:hypothetical protein